MTREKLAFSSAVRVVAEEFGVPATTVRRPMAAAAAKRRLARLRRMAVYLTAVACDIPVHRVASVAGIARRTARCSMSAVEDSRDDPEFDARVQRLEQRLLEAVA